MLVKTACRIASPIVSETFSQIDNLNLIGLQTGNGSANHPSQRINMLAIQWPITFGPDRNHGGLAGRLKR